MEDVLDPVSSTGQALYHEEYDPARPVVCFDETSRQLVEDVRPPVKSKPGRVERYDTEYQRNGTRNLTASLCSWTVPSWRHSRDSRTAAPASQVWYSLLRQVSMSLMEAMVRIASSRSSVNRSCRLRREEHRDVWVSRAPPPESNRNGIPHARRRDLGTRHAHGQSPDEFPRRGAAGAFGRPLYPKAIRELLGPAVEVALLASCNEARPFLDEMVRGNKRAGSG